MQQPWYATREQVKRALDSAETARNNAQVDRAITAASRSIDNLCHRRFYPWSGVKYIGYPRRDENNSWRLWLNQNDLISVTTLTSAGTTIASTDYFLEPANDGPPYTSIEIDQASSAAWSTGDTWQRNIAVTGTWGYWEELEQVGTLADNLDASAADTATITWTDPSLVGVGSILKIDDEYLTVTETSFVDSTLNTSVSLTASAADNSITTTPSSFYIGEVIRIESELMLVVDIGASTITVKRAWDGSVLAAHTQPKDIYGKTGISIDRAQLGSVIGAHVTSDVVYRYVVPELINQLAVAEAIAILQKEIHGYQQVTGESVTRPAAGALRDLRDQAFIAYGRKARTYAV